MHNLTMTPEIIEKIATGIRKAQRILIVSHVRPDGDAVGSLLGLGLALSEAGKDIQMVLEDGVPESLYYLPAAAEIERKVQQKPDYIIVVDCSDLQRTGQVLQTLPQPDLVIDHHVTNTTFGKTNLVLPESPATAEILAQLLPEIGLPVTKQVATCLLNGIVTDTIGFRTESTTPTTLIVAAGLQEAGADLYRIYKNALLTKSFNALKYWGAGLSKLTQEARVVWTSLTLKDRKQSSYPENDDADLINILSSIKDIDVAVIFIEQENNKVKVSWRSRQGIDVSKIAVVFGGGGHKPAAGATIDGHMDDVIEKVLMVTRANILSEDNRYSEKESAIIHAHGSK